MAYGFDKPQRPKCTKTASGRHIWFFVRNGTVRKSVGGFGSGSVQLSLKGLYRCACGETKQGPYNPNAAGADIRDHMAKEET